MPKRIILMYISEVSGHHKATIAVENAIKSINPETETLNLNAFNYTNPLSEKIINQLYLSVIKRTPKFWDYLYDNPKVVKKLSNIKETIHKLNSPKLKKLFDKFNPDIVVCSQAFPCGMVADYKKTYQSSLKLVGVLTDYIPHAYWIYDNVDYFVVPNEDIGLKLSQKGVDTAKIRPFGIPFEHKFNENVSREAVFQNYGLNPGIPTILIMGGGQGLGPIKTIVKSLQKAKSEFQQIIVTGVNKKLFNSLTNKTDKFKKKTVVLGFADNINELMTISDLIITKPGGITTAEALSKKLPMLIVKPIPGQEENNTIYLTENNAAIKIDELKEIHLSVDDLLMNRNKLNLLSESAGRISKPNASLDLAQFLLNLIN